MEDGIVADVTYDPRTGAVYVLAQRDGESTYEVLRISPVTGERIVFSGPGRGSGPALEQAREITIDVDGRRLFVFNWGSEAVYAVALAGAGTAP